jgi:hypothetical protein
MVEKIEGIFDQYSMTEEEAREAPKLTSLQTAFIQNLLYDALLEKMSIGADLGRPNEFIFTHEYLRGQIQAFNMLLNLSRDAHTQQKTEE